LRHVSTAFYTSPIPMHREVLESHMAKSQHRLREAWARNYSFIFYTAFSNVRFCLSLIARKTAFALDG
jgi:hypothetical protein